MVDLGRRVEGGEAVNHMRGQWAVRAGCVRAVGRSREARGERRM